MDYIELKIKVEPSNQETNEIIIAQLSELGFESFTENEEGLSGYIKASDYTNEKETELIDLTIPEGFKITKEIDRIKGQNWNALWESNFEPIIVGNKCIVKASFHFNTPSYQYEIIIDPKMAFGTGHHQTTHQMIDAMLNEDFMGKDVLDMGCGTGVLAILAEMKGAKSVVAIDIDDWAFQNTLENIHMNNCRRIEALLGDVILIKNKTFDIILANINLNILITDMKLYVESLNSKGKLLLSGILKDDVTTISQKALDLGLEHIKTSTRDEWVMISFRKI